MEDETNEQGWRIFSPVGYEEYEETGPILRVLTPEEMPAEIDRLMTIIAKLDQYHTFNCGYSQGPYRDTLLDEVLDVIEQRELKYQA